jgi:hypothetical protein
MRLCVRLESGIVHGRALALYGGRVCSVADVLCARLFSLRRTVICCLFKYVTAQELT